MFLIHSIRLFSQMLSCDAFEKLGAFVCQVSSAHLSYCPTAFLVHARSHTTCHTEPVTLALMVMTLANMHTELSWNVLHTG